MYMYARVCVSGLLGVHVCRNLMQISIYTDHVMDGIHTYVYRTDSSQPYMYVSTDLPDHTL